MLSPGTGSNWSAWLTFAVFVTGFVLTTFPSKARVGGADGVTVPTFQSPEALLYVPWLGTADTKATPAGSRSITWTLVATPGPWLIRVMENVTVSPTFGVGLSTVLASARSAC